MEDEFYLPERDEKPSGYNTIQVWASTYRKLQKLKHRLESQSEEDVSWARLVEGLISTLDVKLENINIRYDEPDGI